MAWIRFELSESNAAAGAALCAVYNPCEGEGIKELSTNGGIILSLL